MTVDGGDVTVANSGAAGRNGKVGSPLFLKFQLLKRAFWRERMNVTVPTDNAALRTQ